MSEKKLKIYFTSDVHGYFYPTTYGDREVKPLGLFQCASEYEKDGNTLVLDGGDILQGSAFVGYCKQKLQSAKIIAEVMNDCGYDYYTIGNHDFNYGQEYQKLYRENHKGTCICQNIADEEGNILYPYRIHTLENGLKVGLVGIVTDWINIWEKPDHIKGLKITDPVAAAKKALDELKGNVDITVCVYHGGFEKDIKTGNTLSVTTENMGYRICEELDFDILLTGHQHMSVDGQWLHDTFVVQPVENAKEYQHVDVIWADGRLEITSERRMAGVYTQQADEAKKQEMEAKRKALIDKYQPIEDKVQEWLDQPAGHLSEGIFPEDKVKMALEGSKIADFFNRIQLYFSEAQISSVGLANQIEGFNKEVSIRDIIATYPYPNTLVVLKVSGEQLKRAMERSAEYFEVDADGTVKVSDAFLQPKVEHYNYDYYMGVSYDIVPGNPKGSRIENLCFQGKPVEAEDEFTLCLNNYRSSGAGGYEVYTECETVKEINIEMTELIMEYFRLHPYIEV